MSVHKKTKLLLGISFGFVLFMISRVEVHFRLFNKNTNRKIESGHSTEELKVREAETKLADEETEADGIADASTSLEEYFEKIGDSNIPYSKKENLKKEIIEKYFANEKAMVVEKGAKNTEVSGVTIKDYVEQLSQLNNKVSLLEKKVDGSNKIITLYIKEL